MQEKWRIQRGGQSSYHSRCRESVRHYVYSRWKSQRTLAQKRRTERLKKLTVRKIRLILISLKRDRKVTYESLVNYLGGKISRTTIR
ncbi:Uncharacterized protein HZ326_31175 [Fusarium oxysporum f. sp. albedinis]|nr:Uncharacterized protein HZ326_31175 [Fusarium oxysporum f. sp. albedinis]